MSLKWHKNDILQWGTSISNEQQYCDQQIQKIQMDAISNSKCKQSLSVGVCATLPDCFCSSPRCFVLTSPDKNIGKRHCSAFPSVARLRAFSQAAERPGNFLETWVDSQCTPLIFILLGLLWKSFSSSYRKYINTGKLWPGENAFCVSFSHPQNIAACFLWSDQVDKDKAKIILRPTYTLYPDWPHVNPPNASQLIRWS